MILLPSTNPFDDRPIDRPIDRSIERSFAELSSISMQTHETHREPPTCGEKMAIEKKRIPRRNFYNLACDSRSLALGLPRNERKRGRRWPTLDCSSLIRFSISFYLLFFIDEQRKREIEAEGKRNEREGMITRVFLTQKARKPTP